MAGEIAIGPYRVQRIVDELGLLVAQADLFIEVPETVKQPVAGKGKKAGFAYMVVYVPHDSLLEISPIALRNLFSKSLYRSATSTTCS